MSKFGMSMVTMGLSAEYAGKVGVNSLWPRTTIATAAVEMIGGKAMLQHSRTPDIMADAAFHILKSDPKTTNGCFFVDDDVLAHHGITDLDGYAVQPGAQLAPDLFV
jgi:citronellol/citronellal dehydrogenase